MTDIPNKAEKQAHAVRVRDALIAVKQEIASEPLLWWGGLSDVHVDLDRILDQRIRLVTERFELPVSE